MKRLASLMFIGVLSLTGCGDDDDDGGDMDASEMDGGGDGGGDASPETATCADYCELNLTTCTGNNEQYASEQECLDYCNDAAGWDAGVSGATSGNTIACRLYHTEVAGGDGAGLRMTHCPHSGSTGDDTCGSWCDNFCQLALENCTGANEAFADLATCMTACEDVPATGEIGAMTGDTIQCRIYHAGAPAAATPATHCPHVRGEAECVAPPT